MKAFIVDDDPITLTLVAFMLNESGVETYYSLSPIEESFYKDIIEFKPDVIILDVYLKGESGFDIARKLRAMPDLDYTPIVAISGSHHLSDRVEAYTTGFIEYVEKPFTKDEILNVVKKYGHSSEILKLCKRIENRETLDHELYHKFD